MKNGIGTKNNLENHKPQNSINILVKMNLIILLVIINTLAAQAATLTVTNTNNDGSGSFRQTINAAANGDTINFGVTGIIYVSSQLIVNKSLQISGPGAESLKISANSFNRIFTIFSGANVQISNLTISNGSPRSGVLGEEGAYGGGIYNAGSLVITNSVISGNKTIVSDFAGTRISGEGGGIHNTGSLTLNSVQIFDNQSGLGGAIFNNNGTITVNSSTINNNQAVAINLEVANGGGIYSDNGIVSLTNSSVISNSAVRGYAGGIYTANSTLTLTNSFVRGNSAGLYGGSYNHNVNASIKDSTITENSGGGLGLSGTTTITDSIISDNSAVGLGLSGTTTISNSKISGNSNGGITNSGDLNLDAVSINGNSASGSGGGISNIDGSVSIKNSTITNNLYGTSNDMNFAGGGGISNAQGMITVTNSTISGNSFGGHAERFGGGLANGVGTITLTNSTVSGNSATRGGGFSGTVNAGNTIISGNTASQVFSKNGLGVLNSSGHNLLATSPMYSIEGNTNGNIYDVDPRLGALQNNGGQTLTHAILPNSPAINAGNNSLIPANTTTDQRGITRILESTVDIGAFESNHKIFRVTKTADTNDGNCNADCSLREAISSANSALTDDSITFDIPTSDPGYDAAEKRYKITLINGALGIANAGRMTIYGRMSGKVNISGGNASGVFDINAGANAEISEITISGGNAQIGGGIVNRGTLKLTQSTVSDNLGGIGGGILNDFGGELTIDNSTISHNSTQSLGGGIANYGTLGVYNATVANNTASIGGGIFNDRIVKIGNTIIADNTATTQTSPDVRGVFNSQGGNLIGKSDSSFGFGINGDQTGTIAAPIDPKLGLLKNNGGQTYTHALLPGSPAVNAGNNAIISVGSDQRGEYRVFQSRIDIGAFELESRYLIVTKTADTNDGFCDNDCSLREAIAVSNSSYLQDLIEFNIPSNDAGFNEFQNQFTIILSGGELRIQKTGKLLIKGPIEGSLTISGNSVSRVFYIYAQIPNFPPEVEIRGLTISNGFSNVGGAINNLGQLQLTDSIVRGNSASLVGGGISNSIPQQFPAAQVKLTNTIVDANLAPAGGGIANLGSLILTNSTISGNAASSGDIAASFDEKRDAAIAPDHLGGSHYGGGIINLSGGTIEITGSTISGNFANSKGGGIYNESFDSFKLTSSKVTDNFAYVGGGIYNDRGDVSLENLTISGNQAAGGGGIYNNSGTTSIMASTLSANQAWTGGGVSNFATLTLINSTLSGNLATVDLGGGLYNNSNSGVTTVTNSTFSDNSAQTAGGGIYFNLGTLTLNNSIIANSTSGDCFRAGGTVNADHSLIEDGFACIFGTNIGNLQGDPGLRVLQNNGGSTLTHSLLPGSLATNAGNNSLVPALLSTDQRGANRIIDTNVDMGSFEAFGPTAASASVSGRIINENGRGISGARITVIMADGGVRAAVSNPFGYYRLEELPVGETYVVNTQHKQYIFSPQVISLLDSVENLNFTALASS